MCIIHTALSTILAMVPVVSIGSLYDGTYNDIYTAAIWMCVIVAIQLYLVKKTDG